MSIRLLTGLPGHGKTLRAVQLMRAAVDGGRPVFVDSRRERGRVVEPREPCIEGLQEFGWQLCDVTEWEELHDGALIVVDEAQWSFPSRRSGDPPVFITALSEHRHRGFDFLLMTQRPTYLDKYVRGLVDQHEHIVRQFNMEASRIYTWGECQDDIQPLSPSTAERGTQTLWKYPREVFGLYKSATMHTMKRRVPLRLKLLPLAVLAVFVLGYYGYRSVKQIGSPSPLAAGEKKPSSGSGAADLKTPPKSIKEFLADLEPRVAGFLWSAPIFDDHKVQAQPETYCMSVENGPCRCISEQGTRIKLDQATCRMVAAEGIYNPYRQPVQPQPLLADVQPAPAVVGQPPSSESFAPEGHAVAHRGIATPYNPQVFGPKTTQN